jgi:AraC-like DNA-binding protein
MRPYSEHEENGGFDLRIKQIADGSFDPESGLYTHFRFYFFEKGSGIVGMDSRNISFIAPCCFCMNEKEKLEIHRLNDHALHAMYFTPSIVNSAFNFDNIRSGANNFSQSELLDLYWLQTFLERSDVYGGVMLVGPATARRILELLRGARKELDDRADNYWPCRSRSFFFELLNLLNSIHLRPQQGEYLTANAGNDQINSIIQYLNEHYHLKITIGEITELFGINRTTLSEKFLQATGMSIISYLTKIRIKIACLLLRDTTLPVAEIMYRAGFEDSTHFGRVFKKETSFTPTQYRGKKQQN